MSIFGILCWVDSSWFGSWRPWLKCFPDHRHCSVANNYYRLPDSRILSKISNAWEQPWSSQHMVSLWPERQKRNMIPYPKTRFCTYANFHHINQKNLCCSFGVQCTAVGHTLYPNLWSLLGLESIYKSRIKGGWQVLRVVGFEENHQWLAM